MSAIEVTGLKKRYRRLFRPSVDAPRGVDLSVPEGSAFGLILDEPTDGIDPMGRVEVRRGTTLFLNSHLLAETERGCVTGWPSCSTRKANRTRGSGCLRDMPLESTRQR